MTDEARDVIARWLANFEGWRIGEAEWEDRHRKVLDAGAAAVRVAEQEAAVQARAEADAKWATELGKLLADGEQVAEQRGAEREREACVLLMEDMREAECADAIRARGKQQEPASA